MSAFTFEQARLAIAYHEAGHAIVALASGIAVESANLLVDWEPWGVSGITYCVFTPSVAVAWGAQAAAGELAALAWLEEAGLLTPERVAACDAEHDFRESVALLQPHGFDLESAWPGRVQRARCLVRALWAEITAVAVALNEAESLTGDEIIAIAGFDTRAVSA